MPTTRNFNNTILIAFQGEKWTRQDFEDLCAYVDLMKHIFDDDDRHSDNTDDEFGWRKEMYRRDW